VNEFLIEAQELIEQRTPFIVRPVELPTEMPPSRQLIQILNTLVAGKNPFGLLAFRTKGRRSTFDSIRIAGVRPSKRMTGSM
jgi:hypothetical protein